MENFFSRFKQYSKYQLKGNLQSTQLLKILQEHGQQDTMSCYLISRIMYNLFLNSCNNNDSMQVLCNLMYKCQQKYKQKALQLMVSEIINELELDQSLSQSDAALILIIYHYISINFLVTSIKILDTKIIDKYFKSDLFLFDESQKQIVFDVLLKYEYINISNFVKLNNKQNFLTNQSQKYSNARYNQISIEQYWDIVSNNLLPFSFTLLITEKNNYQTIIEELKKIKNKQQIYSYSEDTKDITLMLFQFFTLTTFQWKNLIQQTLNALKQYENRKIHEPSAGINQDNDDSDQEIIEDSNENLSFSTLIFLSFQQIQKAISNLNIILTITEILTSQQKNYQSFDFGEIQHQVLIIRCLLSHPHSLLLIMLFQATQFFFFETTFITNYQKNKEIDFNLNNFICTTDLFIQISQHLSEDQIILIHNLAIPATQALYQYFNDLLKDQNDGWTLILHYISQISLQESSIVQLYKISIIVIKIFQSAYKQLYIDVFSNLQFISSAQQSAELKNAFTILKTEKQNMLDDEFNYYCIFKLFSDNKLHLLFNTDIYQSKNMMGLAYLDETSIIFNTRCMEYISNFIMKIQNNYQQSNVKFQHVNSHLIQKDRVLANIIIAIEAYRNMESAGLIFYENNVFSEAVKKYQQSAREIDQYVQNKNVKPNDIELGLCDTLQGYIMQNTLQIYNLEDNNIDDSILQVFQRKEQSLEVQCQIVQALVTILTKDSIFEQVVTLQKLLSLDQKFSQIQCLQTNDDGFMDAMQIILDIINAGSIIQFIKTIISSRYKLMRLYGVGSYVFNTKFMTVLCQYLEIDQNIAQVNDQKIIQLYLKKKVEIQLAQNEKEINETIYLSQGQNSQEQININNNRQSDSQISKSSIQNQQLGISDLLTRFQNGQQRTVIQSVNNESSQSEDALIMHSDQHKNNQQTINHTYSANFQHISQTLIQSFNQQLKQYNKNIKKQASSNMTLVTSSIDKKPFINSYIQRDNVDIYIFNNKQSQQNSNTIDISSQNFFQLTDDQLHQAYEQEIKNSNKTYTSNPLQQVSGQLRNFNFQESCFKKDLQNSILYLQNKEFNKQQDMFKLKDLFNSYKNSKTCCICQNEIIHNCEDNAQQAFINQFCFYFGRWYCYKCVGQYKFPKCFLPYRISQQKFTVSNTGMQQIEKTWSTYKITKQVIESFQELEQLTTTLIQYSTKLKYFLDFLSHSQNCPTLYVQDLLMRYKGYQSLDKQTYFLNDIHSLMFNQPIIQLEYVQQEYNSLVSSAKNILKHNKDLQSMFSPLTGKDQGTCNDKVQYDFACLCLHILQCKECQKLQFKCSNCGQYTQKQVKFDSIQSIYISRLCQSCQKPSKK